LFLFSLFYNKLKNKAMKTMKKKSLDSPEEKREFSKGFIELATIGDVTFGRATLLPGWKWSESVKPIAKTDSCQAPHTQYHISGRLHVKMDDGTEMEFGPGDVGVVPPGHDAWVVGNEPVIMIDFTGLTHYAEPGKHDLLHSSI
jgi:hypothetical protein